MERGADLHRAELVLYFNSSKVRLELEILNNIHNVSKFQFQQGTIGTCSRFTVRIASAISIPARYDWNRDTFVDYRPVVNFNSSKVRLEPGTHTSSPGLMSISIPARYDWNCPHPRWYASSATHFNSSKVRLERFLCSDPCSLWRYFNSSKVRLEPEVNRIWSQPMKNFNSSKVRLEPSRKDDTKHHDDFNSSKVRLEQHYEKVPAYENRISIPARYDWNN